MLRKSENPVTLFLLAAVLMVVGAAGGFVEGAKVRNCPTKLADGRRLIYIRLADNVCAYERPLPRPLDLYSPTELRRIAAARERSERTRP